MQQNTEEKMTREEALIKALNMAIENQKKIIEYMIQSIGKPKEKKARWISRKEGAKYPYGCSACKAEAFYENNLGYNLTKYCAHCGALMENPSYVYVKSED